MTRAGIFGWSYPPGAASDPNAPWNQQEGPCDVCGMCIDLCVCPECPMCGETGNRECYGGDLPHLQISQEQIESLLLNTERREEENYAWEEPYTDEMVDDAIDTQIRRANT